MFEAQSMALVTARFPAVAQALAAAAVPSRVELVAGARCPTLRVDGVQLAGAFEPLAEAALQAARVPTGTLSATLYDPGQGALPRALLSRAELKQLTVVVLAPAAMREVLRRFDQRDWLKDPRLTLRLPLADERPTGDWTVSPAALRLADPPAEPLRDQLVLALSSRHQIERFAEQREMLDARMAANLDRLASDGDVTSLFGRHPGAHAVVVGTGPSLSGELAWLRACRSEVVVFAVNSALLPLLAADVAPDVVLALDPALTLEKHLACPAAPALAARYERLVGVPLVYAAVVHPRALDAWRGPRLGMHTVDARYDAIASQVPKGRVWSSGTVLHAAVDLAAKSGALTITILGADFGYPAHRSHAEGSVGAQTVDAASARLRTRDGHGQPLSTDINLLGYLHDLDDWAGRHPGVRLQKRGRSGAAMVHVPFMGDAS